jgi:hypothetical protein
MAVIGRPKRIVLADGARSVGTGAVLPRLRMRLTRAARRRRADLERFVVTSAAAVRRLGPSTAPEREQAHPFRSPLVERVRSWHRAAVEHPARPLGLGLILAVALASWAIVAMTSRAMVVSSDAVTFIAFGDPGTNSAGQLALRDRMVEQSSQYQFGLMLGDGAYPVGSLVDYNAKFFPVYSGLFQGSGQVPPSPTSLTPKPLWTTPGNHDYETANQAGYRDSFAMPTNGPAGLPAESYYTFDVGQIHFVSFDSHFLVGFDQTPTQTQIDSVRNWLITDLDANTDRVTIVIEHHPAFTAGEHHGEGEETKMRFTWYPIFATHGVDALLSGHEHSYQRNSPQSGLTSFVSGGGGGVLTAVTPQSYTAASLSDFHFLKVTVDGCTISTVAVRDEGTEFDPWSFTAPTCGGGGPTPTPAPTGTIFSDGFEGGTFGSWTSAQAGTGGTAAVQTTTKRSGSYAAGFSAVATTGSYGYARKNLGTAFGEVRVALSTDIASEGASGGNVPILRLYNASGTRILALYRQNLAGDKLYVQHSGAYNSTTGTLPLNTWRRFEVHVIVAGAGSTVEIWADGTLIHRTLLANLGTSGVQTIQIGNDTSGQAFSAFIDDVVVTDGSAVPSGTPTPAPSASATPVPTGTATPAPTGTATPAPTGTPAPTATATPTSGPTATPTGSPGAYLRDGFESGGLAAWSVKTGGGGGVTVSTSPVKTGTYAARLSATTAGGSYAYARASLGSARLSVTADMAVRVATEGASGANVPLLRLYDSAGTRMITVYRQNLASNRVYVSYGGVNYLTSGQLPLGTWAQLRVRVIVNGNSSTVDVYLDGTRVHASTTAALGTAGILSAQLGNDTRRQAFSIVVDDVVIGP